MNFLAKTLCVAVAVLTGLASTAASATIQYTSWQSADTGSAALDTDGLVTTLSYQQYNAAQYGGYALASVELSLAGTGYAVYQFMNLMNAVNNFQIQLEVTVDVSASTVPGLVVVLPVVQDIPRAVAKRNAAGSTYASPGFSFVAPDYSIASTGTKSGTVIYQGATLTSAINNLFSGTGIVGLDTSATAQDISTAGGNHSTTLLSAYTAALNVRYGFDVPVASGDVPEPSSIALIGLGLGAVGRAMRRRRARLVS